MKKQKETIDTETVIAPMNIDGMPWYDNKGGSAREQEAREQEAQEPIPPRQLRRFTLGATLAALAVCLVFIAAGFLFICLCLYLWR